MKTVTIHQPNYLPYIGLFNKVKQAEVFIILDTALFSKNSVTNRNKIRTPDGWTYLTIPIERKNHQKPIKDVDLPKNNKWMENHWKSIMTSYGKARHFKEYRAFFEELYKSSFAKLAEINMKIIGYLLEQFNIDVEIIKSSSLDIGPNLRKTDLLIKILKVVNAGVYLSGEGGKNYLELDKFKENRIEIEFQRFEHPKYEQQFSGFVPYLSAIDLLFNVGKKSSGVI